MAKPHHSRQEGERATYLESWGGGGGVGGGTVVDRPWPSHTTADRRGSELLTWNLGGGPLGSIAHLGRNHHLPLLSFTHPAGSGQHLPVDNSTNNYEISDTSQITLKSVTQPGYHTAIQPGMRIGKFIFGGKYVMSAYGTQCGVRSTPRH